MTNSLRSLLLIGLLALITGLQGCEGKGCFGLCDERDDDDDMEMSEPPPTGPSTSCIIERQITTRVATLFYTDDTNALDQAFRFADAELENDVTTAPVLVWITGADFSGGALTGLPPEATLIARRLGAHLAPITYRNAATADWPAQIFDVKTAIQYLVDQNEFLELNIDTSRIYVGGDSAGALLAALAGTTSSVQELTPDLPNGFTARIALVIGLGGVYNLETLVADSNGIESMCGNVVPPIAGDPVIDLLNCDASTSSDPLGGCDPMLLGEASPSTHIFTDDSPMLFYTGGMDCTVPSNQSVAFESQFAEGNSTIRTFANDDDSLASFTTAQLAEDIVMIPELDCDDDT